ncbi:MAG: hypothetical protein M3Q75_00945 [Gemmatimonadota bacterium]|nr:hypothetical protein [Gemmatimonadota bacterium]
MAQPRNERLSNWMTFPDDVRQRLIMGDLDALWAALDELETRQETDKKDTNDRLAKVLWAFIGLITTLATAAASAYIASGGAS